MRVEVELIVTVGTNPYVVATDGTSIFVANSGSDNVSRLNPGSYERTANSCQRPGTPASSCSPRSSNSSPDPTTRSGSVLETRTSPASALPDTRWPM